MGALELHMVSSPSSATACFVSTCLTPCSVPFPFRCLPSAKSLQWMMRWYVSLSAREGFGQIVPGALIPWREARGGHEQLVLTASILSQLPTWAQVSTSLSLLCLLLVKVLSHLTFVQGWQGTRPARLFQGTYFRSCTATADEGCVGSIL